MGAICIESTLDSLLQQNISIKPLRLRVHLHRCIKESEHWASIALYLDRRITNDDKRKDPITRLGGNCLHYGGWNGVRIGVKVLCICKKRVTYHDHLSGEALDDWKSCHRTGFLANKSSLSTAVCVIFCLEIFYFPAVAITPMSGGLPRE